jgi:hypothetical protein
MQKTGRGCYEVTQGVLDCGAGIHALVIDNASFSNQSNATGGVRWSRCRLVYATTGGRASGVQFSAAAA